MAKITVWTRQHQNVWNVLCESGRYIAHKEYIRMENEEHTDIILRAYDWLTLHSPNAERKPEDVSYPIWVSVDTASKMPPERENVILELSVDERDVVPINITKWGMILNYSYIPKDKEDEARHRAFMERCGTDDVRAVMTNFYPEAKREIMASWDRLFDDSVVVGNDLCYGIIWEIRREWVVCAE